MDRNSSRKVRSGEVEHLAIYRSMRRSCRGWGTEMENKKISRGTPRLPRKKDQHLEGGRNSFSPKRRDGSSVPWESWTVPCCLKGQRTSHIATKEQKPLNLSTHKHLKQVWHQQNKQSRSQQPLTKQSQMQRDPYFSKNTQRTTQLVKGSCH